jgi:hypothetical protein
MLVQVSSYMRVKCGISLHSKLDKMRQDFNDNNPPEWIADETRPTSPPPSSTVE